MNPDVDNPDTWWRSLTHERKRSIMRWLNPGHGTRAGGRLPAETDTPFPDLPDDLAAMRDDGPPTLQEAAGADRPQ